MGLPGVIQIKITTTFDEDANSASRTIQFVNGWGLNCLSACTLGTGKYWHINRNIMADTIKLPDGTYTLDRQHVGPEQFDYKWSPTKDDQQSL